MQVSVIVPTYNRVGLIARAIESLCIQTYPDVEILVVDDGSTDGTDALVARLTDRCNYPIRYMYKQNGGCASARNCGLSMASGELIAFLDSDDALVPTALETLVTTLSYADADLVYSPSIEVFPDGHESINYPVAVDCPDRLAIEHFKSTNVRNGAYLFRRDLLAATGKLDESLLHNEDSDFFQRAAIHGKAVYSNSPTVKVYHHGHNKSRNRVAIYRALLKSAINILAEYPDFAHSLGDCADTRLAEIKTLLIEGLIQAGEFDEATEIAQTVNLPFRPGLHLSLRLRSQMPLQIEHFYLRLKRHLPSKVSTA